MLFSYGFRPFFLLVGLYGVIAMLAWLTGLFTGMWPGDYIPAQLWHGHEMIFGFVAAAIAGFLLTAVPSWTGRRALSGGPLIALVIAWLAGRLVLAFDTGLPQWLIAFIDLAFFPLLGLLLAPSLLRGKPRNMVFLVFLGVLFLANLIFHMAIANDNRVLASSGLMLGVNTVLLIITIIGGRIVPAFTLGAVRRTDETFTILPAPLLDRAAIASILILLVIDLAWPYSTAAGWIAVIAAVIHVARYARWKTLRIVAEPIVWILHVGYAWVIIGLALKGTYILTGIPFSSAWLHALTAGAFATMILAVMTRAALGHTGRPLVAPPPIVASYILVTLAAIVRVAGPLFPGSYAQSIAIAGILWIGAFTLFLLVYTPILLLPRADNKSG